MVLNDNVTSGCQCSPKCERIDYVVTLSQAELSQHTTHLFALEDKIPNDIESLSHIQDWASVGIRNKTYSVKLYLIGQAMKAAHMSIINILALAQTTSAQYTALQEQLPTLQTNFNRLLASGEQLVSVTNTALTWMANSFFFPASIQLGETFNVRVAVDIIRQMDEMQSFYPDLLQHITAINTAYNAYESDVSLLEASLHTASVSNSLSTTLYQTSSDVRAIPGSVSATLEPLHQMYTGYLALRGEITADELLLEYPHIMTPTTHQFYKYITLHIVLIYAYFRLV